MKSLTEQYRLIKEGKGSKDVFTKTAKAMYPQYITNNASFNQTEKILKYRGLINESIIGDIIPQKKKESYETAFEKYLAEEAKKSSQEVDTKAEVKKPSKEVDDLYDKNFNRKDTKNLDNVIFDQLMRGYYIEMKNPKNTDKTIEQVKDIVLKNLEKNPIFYVENGQFGVEGLGYTKDAPGLGEPKEPKGKYKSSGYGDLKEEKFRKVVNSLIREELNFNKEENLLREAINKMVREELNENVVKQIKSIRKESQIGALALEYKKIKEAIDTRKAKIERINEDESLSELVDKKQIKKVEKEIKALEKALDKTKKNIEKVKGKEDKPKTKDVVTGEGEPIEEEVINEAPPSQDLEKGLESAEAIKKALEDVSKIELEEDTNELPQEIINQIVPMYVEEEMEIEDIASMYPEMYNEVVEFLEGYDLGLDYDI